jgi:hypothetical protein
MATIEELLHRRTDLSTFLVHFTRDYGTPEVPARENLLSILLGRRCADELHVPVAFGQLFQSNGTGTT